MKRQHPNMTKLHRTLTAKERQVFEAPVFAHVATLDPDGAPQVSAVWVMLDGDDVILNTAEGRTTARNLARDGRVAVSVTDPGDPYRNISVKGHVVQTIGEEQGAGAGINALAKKYIGQDVYPFRADGERRVQYRVAIDAVSGWGDD